MSLNPFSHNPNSKISDSLKGILLMHQTPLLLYISQDLQEKKQQFTKKYGQRMQKDPAYAAGKAAQKFAAYESEAVELLATIAQLEEKVQLAHGMHNAGLQKVNGIEIINRRTKAPMDMRKYITIVAATRGVGSALQECIDNLVVALDRLSTILYKQSRLLHKQ